MHCQQKGRHLPAVWSFSKSSHIVPLLKPHGVHLFTTPNHSCNMTGAESPDTVTLPQLLLTHHTHIVIASVFQRYPMGHVKLQPSVVSAFKALPTDRFLPCRFRQSGIGAEVDDQGSKSCLSEPLCVDDRVVSVTPHAECEVPRTVDGDQINSLWNTPVWRDGVGVVGGGFVIFPTIPAKRFGSHFFSVMRPIDSVIDRGGLQSSKGGLLSLALDREQGKIAMIHDFPSISKPTVVEGVRVALESRERR